MMLFPLGTGRFRFLPALVHDKHSRAVRCYLKSLDPLEKKSASGHSRPAQPKAEGLPSGRMNFPELFGINKNAPTLRILPTKKLQYLICSTVIKKTGRLYVKIPVTMSVSYVKFHMTPRLSAG